MSPTVDVEIRRNRHGSVLAYADRDRAARLLEDHRGVLTSLYRLVDRRHGSDGEIVARLTVRENDRVVDDLDVGECFRRDLATDRALSVAEDVRHHAGESGLMTDGGEQVGGEIDQWVNDIHQGDAGETLREMPKSSVHCVMTSPPYYGLRDYGVDGQIGLEGSLAEFVETLVDVGEDLRRVLRDDGCWWLNLGDSFVEKQKTLAPHRVAIALQEAGWIVRSDAVWSKPNPMPHPVKDRLHEHKEFVFQLTPTREYWFDLDAIRESHTESSLNRTGRNDNTERPFPGNDQTLNPDQFLHPNGKNPGDVFEIPVKAFPEAHFAVYPPELCEVPLKSSCPPKVCAVCGTPYGHTVSDADLLANPNDRDKKERALELYEQSDLELDHLEAARDVGLHDEYASNHHSDGGYGKVDEEKAELAQEAREVLGAYTREFSTGARTRTGWEQACDCPTVGDYTESGLVLDPFAGAGTTALVAKRLGRRFVGIDLNPDYVALAQRRVGVDVDEPERLLGENETNLAAFADGGESDAE